MGKIIYSGGERGWRERRRGEPPRPRGAVRRSVGGEATHPRPFTPFGGAGLGEGTRIETSGPGPGPGPVKYLDQSIWWPIVDGGQSSIGWWKFDDGGLAEGCAPRSGGGGWEGGCVQADDGEHARADSGSGGAGRGARRQRQAVGASGRADAEVAALPAHRGRRVWLQGWRRAEPRAG